MTKDSAELVVATKNALEPTWFCPLINRMCTKLCLCYYPSRVRAYRKHYQATEDTYMATEPYCANQMFFRECSHNT